ncbi:NifB/NifX family molybdenum-iron cluster-binding protein [Phocaeicola plebeius]|uniref:NifB/NifX family molybdenum-iron cluster-binding protein n=1 Tax=Phocaeicola plebeius TaxID=310297 RepID=UPI003AF66225
MKKIALPTRNGLIDDHFGHCEFYTIFTVDEENRISRTQVLPSPQCCGCKSDIASKLQADGVTVMLAGNMGAGALAKLSACGIEVIRGCHGSVIEVAEAYLAGKIQDSGVGCDHHHEDGEHQCPNH